MLKEVLELRLLLGGIEARVTGQNRCGFHFVLVHQHGVYRTVGHQSPTQHLDQHKRAEAVVRQHGMGTDTVGDFLQNFPIPDLLNVIERFRQFQLFDFVFWTLKCLQYAVIIIDYVQSIILVYLVSI